MANEQELINQFDIMVSQESERDEPTKLFEGWNDEQKASYMKQLALDLPQPKEAANLENMEVPDSVLFDVTNPEQAQQNYVASIGHYRSWQYAGSDRRFEFGSKRQRTFVTRSTGTFVFYFQLDDLLVGLIVDGQRGWAEGAITRDRRDGRETVLQFARKGNELDYIRSRKTHTLKYDGNYTKGQKIYKIKLGLWQLWQAIKAIGGFIPAVSKSEPEAIHWQILVLFAPEAGRVNHVFGKTSSCLSFSHDVPTVILTLGDIEAFVLNYLKLSRRAIDALDGEPFVHVKGTTPRNLYQLLLAVLILRRDVVHTTHFMLPDATPMKDGPNQGKRGKALMGEQKLEYDNAKGTTYQVGKHDGTNTYQSEDWLTHPFEQDKESCKESHQLMMLLVLLSQLCGCLSKNNVPLADGSHRLATESPDPNDKKNLLLPRIQPEDAPIVNSKALLQQEHHVIHKLDLTEGQNVTQRHITSTFILCPERSIGDLGYQEGLHQKKDQSTRGGRFFSMRMSGVGERSREEVLHDHPTRRLPVALGTDNSKVPEIMRRHVITRETANMDARNKKAKLMVVEHEKRCRVTQGNSFDRTSGFHASFKEDVDSRTVLMTNVYKNDTIRSFSLVSWHHSPFMSCYG
uniref:Uncharacterized protein n=1 Tax=Avena sativa TaxID=4498 RepID=A0ACD5X5K2_AVESA